MSTALLLVLAASLAPGTPQPPPDEQPWAVRARSSPRASARIEVDGGSLLLDAGASAAGADPLAGATWTFREAPVPMPTRDGLTVRLPLPAAEGVYLAQVAVRDVAGREDVAGAVLEIRGGRAHVPDPLAWTAPWIERAVIHGAVPHLSGGLRGLRARLDDLAAVGVNTLWLSPISGAPADDYGYAVTDHFDLRPEVGSEEDLRALVEAAHARGLRVILDFVANHTSARHPFHEDAERRGTASPYHTFYDRGPGGEATHYFDWSHLPNLDLARPEVETWLVQAAAHWVRRFDVDGLRLDAAWGPMERTPGFWRRFAAELHRIRPDLLLLAEAPAGDPAWRDAGLALAYDWTDRPGEWAWQAVFEDRDHEADRLRERLALPPATAAVHFLENNDTGPRFVTRYGRAILPAAAALVATLPGAPLLFTGQEDCAQFEPYLLEEELRAPVDPTCRETWRRLLHLRASDPELRGGDVTVVETGPDPEVLGYLRGSRLVLLDLDEAPREVTVTAPARAMRDLLDGSIFHARGGLLRVPLPGGGARVLAPLDVTPAAG